MIDLGDRTRGDFFSQAEDDDLLVAVLATRWAPELLITYLPGCLAMGLAFAGLVGCSQGKPGHQQQLKCLASRRHLHPYTPLAAEGCSDCLCALAGTGSLAM
jgi:hypothetical protein